MFVTDAANREVLEYDGATGAIQRWYAYGLGSNDVLNQTNVVAGTRAALIPDIQGSIIATLDSATASLTKAGYLPYGKSTSAPASFGYTGQRIDPETNGLYYYRTRHYSPLLGRFLQTDPSGTKGGVNLYTYAKNDPLNLVDISGLAPDAPGSGTNFYVNSAGTVFPATGYRAIGGPAVPLAEAGNLMSSSGTTYITFNNLSGLTGQQAGQLLQLPYAPSQFATFDTLQIVSDLNVPTGRWNTSSVLEPITSTFPEFGSGGATQAITSTPIQNYTLQPFRPSTP